MRSAEALAGAVLLHNADFNDGPDPRHHAENSQRQHGEAQLSYRTAGVSGIKVVNAQCAKKNAKNNEGCPALVSLTIDRRNMRWLHRGKRWGCNLRGRRSRCL